MDLSKLKAKLADLDASQNNSGKLIWKPKVGKQVIRILPNKYSPDFPFVELYFYYNFGKRTLISPSSFGKPDPIKEFSDNLKATGDKYDYRIAKQLDPKFRVYVPILVRGEESEGVKFWGFGTTVFQELLKTIDDPDYGDITSPKNGRDVTIEYIAAKGKDDYPTTMIRVKPDRSEISNDRAVLSMVSNMENVASLWTEPTYDELKTHLDNFLTNSVETPVTTEQPTVFDGDSSLKSYATSVNAVSDDFDDLFKDM